MRIVIAIDPGLTGAYACVDPATRTILELDNLPVIRDAHYGWIDGCLLAERFTRLRVRRGGDAVPATAVIEKISPNPKNGMVTIKGQMMALGSILAVAQIAGMRIEFVTPQSWKGAMGLLQRRGTKLTPTQVKRQSLDKARLLFPEADLSLAKHHNRAEALLIAEWYLRHELVELRASARRLCMRGR